MKRARVLLGMVLLTVVLSLVIVSGNLKTATAQTAGSKFCSVVVSGNWRDTTWVPSGWNAGDCRNFRIAVGAETYQLGCIFSSGGVSFGASNGGTPRLNCGW